jgi:hypothetical protein
MGYLQSETKQTTCTQVEAGRIVVGYVPPTKTVPERGGSSSVEVPLGSSIKADGSGFEACQAGTIGNDPADTICIECPAGQSSTPGAIRCNPCDKGKYSAVSGTTCEQCPEGTFQEQFQEPSLFCKACPTGYENIKTGESTCQDKGFKKPEDCNLDQYLNDTDNDPASWQCIECPNGAYCKREGKPGTVSDIRSLAGYWRVPYIDTNGDIWSAGNTTFLRCPFPEDCRGVVENKGQEVSNGDKTNVTEGCVDGTRGPLCALCADNHNRDLNKCTVCTNQTAPLRIGLLVLITLTLFVLVWQCRKKIQKKFMKYKPLWRDGLRVAAINITFAQINSSLPFVIDVQWPAEWNTFTRHFAFVNIGKSESCCSGTCTLIDFFTDFLFSFSHRHFISGWCRVHW